MRNLVLFVFTLILFMSCKEEKKEVNTSTNKDIVTSTEMVNKDEVTKITASPKFINYENFDGSTTSLDDLKGKYVYIDVWATWCPPCIAEIPHLQKIEKKYHDKNLVFVSISLDKESNKSKWKKMIVDKKLGGIQLFAGKDETFTKGYNIRGIPRFILINPEGNIENANAPRPSNSSGIAKLFAKI